MKNQFYFLFILLLTLFSFQSKASHLVGSDISYQCTSTPGIYKVTMKIYRDCAGIPLCTGCTNPIPNGTVSGCTTGSSGWSTQIIGASSGCTGTNFGSFTLSALRATSGYDIIQTCTSVSTICTNCNTRNAGTFAPGIEIYTYEGSVDLSGLPISCCRVTLGANTCCRNNALTTIVPGSFQAVCEIDRCQIPCNSAPTFTNDATALVCSGVDFVYNLGAMDPDGDSLSYAFGQSLQGIGTPVAYVPPYSAAYPFIYFGAPNANAPYPAGLHIDSLTGDITFRPLGVFVADLVIEVKQWKLISGVRVNVGMTRRDMQFQTQNCTSNKIPIIKVYKNNVLQSGTSGFTTMAGTQLCLDIVAEDQGQVSPVIVADTTDLRWNTPGLYLAVMANATFTRNYILNQRGINGPKADSFKFCWTPPLSAIREEPYLFTVTGLDRFCPIKTVVTRGITIKVEAKTILIDSTTKNIFCNNRNTTTNVNYRTSKINLLSGNVYTVQLSDSLGSFTNATTIGTKTTNDSIGFIPVTIPSGLPLNKNYKIRVNSSSDTVNLGTAYSINFVAGFSTPIITNNKDSFCQGLVSTFKVTPKTAGLTFKWLKNNVMMANQTKDSLLVDSAFTYKAIVSNTGCSDTSNAKYLTVFQKPIANFSINNIMQCLTGNSFGFTNLSASSNGQTWSFGDTSISNVLSPTKTYTNSGIFTVKLVAKNTVICLDSITKNITVNNQASADFIINNASQCLSGNSFVFTNSSTGSNSQTWNFGDASNSNTLSPTKTYNNSGVFTVKLLAKNTANCNDSITKNVTVNAQAVADFTINNASQCLNGNSFNFTNLSTNSNSQNWNFGDASNSNTLSPTKTYTNSGSFTVKLIAKNTSNCNDSITKTVTVKASPVIGNITGTTSPSSLSTPFNYIVLNQSNTVYDWTVNNGTIQSGQGTNIISVLWSSVGTGKVNAKITNVNSCADSNNLTVNISSVGINNLSLDNDLKVYPNPTKTSITITNKTNLVGKKYIITNLVGQTVLSGKLNLDETIVNLENLQSGIYLLSIDGLNKQSIKVIKE